MKTKSIILVLSYALTLFIFTLFIILTPLIVSKEYMAKEFGPSTKEQILLSFKMATEKPYSCFVLGNSKLYRGINPSFLDLNCYNFAHDNDSFNQNFYKLKFVERRNNSIKYLILGVDYSEFSFLSNTRNYVYSNLLGQPYASDYKSENIFYQLYALYNLQYGLTKTLTLHFFSKNGVRQVPFLKLNGQFITYGHASKNDKVTTLPKILEIQKKYFEQILQNAAENHITVFLVMPPARDIVLQSYSVATIQNMDRMFNSYATPSHNVFYLNYSNDKRFSMIDYTDVDHLNESAANQFTKILNLKIKSILNH